MRSRQLNIPALARSLALFLAWTLAFALSYAQSPLYTSNQNQYFLHGLARADVGYLSDDWLANTRDPTPVFSWLVEWTWRLFHAEALFYLHYALLMGVYLFSLIGILSALFDLKSPTKGTILLGLLVLVHSAALRQLLAIGIGESWRYALEGGVAGQRLLGDVLQPSVFGVLLLLSIYYFLRERDALAVILLALAATVHPTYLLSAAALSLIYLFLRFRETRSIKQPLRFGLLALVLVLPILIYTLTIFAPTNPETYARVQERLVHFRLPHHALVAEWFNASTIFQSALVALALWLSRKTKVFWLLAIPSALALILTFIQLFTGSNALALLFPWRLSAFLVPLSVALILGRGLEGAWARFGARLAAQRKWVFVAIGLLLLGLMAASFYRFRVEAAEKLSAPERPMMDFVAEHLQPGQTFLIPIGMEDFRLTTGAPIVVDFKAIPYWDSEVAAWLTRVLNVSNFYRDGNAPGNCEFLRILSDEFSATHVVLPKENFSLDCDGLIEIYNDGVYAVREIDFPQN